MAQVNLYGYSEGSEDVHLCTGPLYHAAPLAFSLAAPLAFGVGVVLMDQWDPEAVSYTHLDVYKRQV